MPLKSGDTLLNGHYRIEKRLGRGGFGFVYQARETLLGETVAIKELIPALVGDEGTLKRFLAEARATMKLRHDHIVGTHNIFQDGENYHIVMECMSGGPLETRLRDHGPLGPDEAVRVAAQICQGLAYAHDQGVVHCDLKPANILFDDKDNAHVADFGIAHVSGEMGTRTWHTPTGFVAGTLPYMSPEQTDGQRDDPRIDVYALGAILYRLLTGRTYLKFDTRQTPRSISRNVRRICGDKPQPPSHHDDCLPVWLDAVVLKTLEKEPEDRYASARQLREALLAGGEPAADGPATVVRSKPRPKRKAPVVVVPPPPPPDEFPAIPETITPMPTTSEPDTSPPEGQEKTPLPEAPPAARTDAPSVDTPQPVPQPETPEPEVVPVDASASEPQPEEAGPEEAEPEPIPDDLAEELVPEEAESELTPDDQAEEPVPEEPEPEPTPDDLAEEPVPEEPEAELISDDLAEEPAPEEAESELTPDDLTEEPAPEEAEAEAQSEDQPPDEAESWEPTPIPDTWTPVPVAPDPERPPDAPEPQALAQKKRGKLFDRFSPIFLGIVVGLIGASIIIVLMFVGGIIDWPLAPTQTPIPTKTPSPTLQAGDSGAPNPIPSSTSAPTATYTPTPTRAPRRPSATPSPTRTSTPQPSHPSPTARTRVDPPELESPKAEQTLSGGVTFKWQYGELLASEGFQVLIWREGDGAHNGAADFTRLTGQPINLDNVPQIQGSGAYYWTVVVVDRTTEQRISREASPRRFWYDVP